VCSSDLVSTTGLLIVIIFTDTFKNRLDLAGWLGFVSATLFYIAINSVSNTPDVYLSGFIIILFFLLIFFPLSFPATLVIGLVCTFLFGVSIPLMREITFGDLATIYSQYLVTLIGGNIAVYLLNKHRRWEFLSSREITRQREQYEMLLNQVFPQQIVSRMQNGESRIADKFTNVAVLFADIVGFTKTASRYPPEAVVEFVDALFNRFDQLVETHGVEKIKTIGDAYMAAAGVPSHRESHIQAIAGLALSMQEAANAYKDLDGEAMRIRIGIHAGPLIAGVIGKARFGYDLWGDTVNVASRMQSTTEPDTIQVTKSIYQELAQEFELQPHGKIEVKGKGAINTWHLIGRKK